MLLLPQPEFRNALLRPHIAYGAVSGIPNGLVNSHTYCAVKDNSHMIYDKDKITELRMRLGISMNELARRSHIKGPSMWAIERGKTKDVRFTTLTGIAAALGVPVQEILKKASGKTNKTLQNDLHTLLLALDEPNRLAMIAAARALLAQQKK